MGWYYSKHKVPTLASGQAQQAAKKTMTHLVCVGARNATDSRRPSRLEGPKMAAMPESVRVIPITATIQWPGDTKDVSSKIRRFFNFKKLLVWSIRSFCKLCLFLFLSPLPRREGFWLSDQVFWKRTLLAISRLYAWVKYVFVYLIHLFSVYNNVMFIFAGISPFRNISVTFKSS